MNTAARWRAASASDPGLQRTVNEDRVWFDEARGIYLVVDGLGGHAAGETAAATAVDVISRVLQSPADIKSAIGAANNEIYRLAEDNPEWRGMACVLTLAMLRDGQVFVGHVGDSRLYLYWNGQLRKMTSDHSPVGEQEDQGLLTEAQAMNHPRRNEVFRDVGSAPRRGDEGEFIETNAFQFPEDGAVLLCSDGLTDCVTAAGISGILERFDGDPEHSAQRLIEAANAAGGKDNISVVLITGPEFTRADSTQGAASRERHAATRPRSDAARSAAWIKYSLLALLVALAGFALWRFATPWLYPTAHPAAVPNVPAHVIKVNASDARGIIDALATANNGDTIAVPPGDFLGPLLLKQGVTIAAGTPHLSVVRCDPSAIAEPGVALVARSVQHATVKGLKIVSDDTHPLKTGVLLVDSSVTLTDLDISGAVYSGVRVEGNSRPILRENFIHGNGGSGVVVRDVAAPKLERNQILQNGLVVNSVRPGIDASPSAKPILEQNLISGNGADEPLQTGPAETHKQGRK